MFIAEVSANLRERGASQFFAEIHADLPGHRNGFRIIFRFEILNTHFEMVRDHFLDHFNCDRLLSGPQDVMQRLLGHRQCYFRSLERAVGNQADQCALEFADIRFYFTGDVESDVVGHGDILPLRFLLDNGDLRFEVGRLDVCDQTPFEPGVKTLFKRRYLSRGTIS